MSASSRPGILLSQNFLRHPALAASLLDACDLRAGDVVYEIGPGKGILTQQLALRCQWVVAVEKDPRLADRLRGRFAAVPLVTIHQGDFLEYPLPHGPYKVVANIPFNITAAIVNKLAAAECPPVDAYLTMQREAAGVLLGEPHESLRSVLLKPWYDMEIVHRFRRTDFIPAPRVDVVMLRLRKRGPPLIGRADRQCFRDFVVHLFTTRHAVPGSALKDVFSRRQLRRISVELGLDFDRLPTLTSIPFDHWLRLFAYFKTVSDDRALRMIAGSEERLLHQQQRLHKIHRTQVGGQP
ncbi:MAG TPA: rRNA adenine N(6)-methyltransferase family protein [Ktedonobacterales bacterium]